MKSAAKGADNFDVDKAVKYALFHVWNDYTDTFTTRVNELKLCMECWWWIDEWADGVDQIITSEWI